MRKLPEDEFVTVELVHDGDPVERGTDVSHLVVQVESMADTLDRIELVQWPAGHLDGMTAADWPEKED
ncbi:hypothetical protein [Amycolatopsis circi]|uniref:hypothetical protein n=1 Tax=Amycolatopsis circi TaxID=871959 RepID=UPI001ABFDE3A|nr:hypothetical protein [Amycolatopsis circi]